MGAPFDNNASPQFRPEGPGGDGDYRPNRRRPYKSPVPRVIITIIVPTYSTDTFNIRLYRCSFTSPFHTKGVVDRYKFSIVDLTHKSPSSSSSSSVTNSKKTLRCRRIRVQAVCVIILFHIRNTCVIYCYNARTSSTSENKSRNSTSRPADECVPRQ